MRGRPHDGGRTIENNDISNSCLDLLRLEDQAGVLGGTIATDYDGDGLGRDHRRGEYLGNTPHVGYETRRPERGWTLTAMRRETEAKSVRIALGFHLQGTQGGGNPAEAGWHASHKEGGRGQEVHNAEATYHAQ